MRDDITEDGGRCSGPRKTYTPNATGYRRSRPERTCPWRRRPNASASVRAAVATMRPSRSWSMRPRSSGTKVHGMPGGEALRHHRARLGDAAGELEIRKPCQEGPAFLQTHRRAYAREPLARLETVRAHRSAAHGTVAELSRNAEW